MRLTQAEVALALVAKAVLAEDNINVNIVKRNSQCAAASRRRGGSHVRRAALALIAEAVLEHEAAVLVQEHFNAYDQSVSITMASALSCLQYCAVKAGNAGGGGVGAGSRSSAGA